MVILTESSVLARARVPDLDRCTKLNVWGCSLTDISIVKECKNLQVFSASCNDIVSLRDLTACQQLQELYVRENQISSLEEVIHLGHLPRLRVLWLAGNPCCAVFGNDEKRYRLWVLSQLPHLDRLDNTEVKSEERKRLEEIDIRELLPEKLSEPTCKSSAASVSVSVGDNRSSYSSAAGESLQSANKHSTPPAQSPLQLRHHTGENGYFPQTHSAELAPPSSKSGVSENYSGFVQRSSSASVPTPSPQSNQRPLSVISSIQNGYRPEEPSSCRCSTASDLKSPENSLIITPGPQQRPRNLMSQTPLRQSGESIVSNSSGTGTHAKLRNVNILSATLNLVKELDTESLEILQLDINRRLTDMQLQDNSAFSSQ